MRNLKGNNGKNLGIVLLAILAASVVLPTLVRAVDYNVGVKVGDWIKYGQFTVTWTGNATEPSYITDEKKIDWARIDVENISGTTVTVNLMTHYNNGTQTNQSDTVDVASNSMGGYFVIASNLKSGDHITNGTLSSIITQTTTRTYAGATRNVNLFNITTTGYGNLTITTRIYWDQTTGIMVEAYTKAPDYGSPGANENPSGFMEMSIKATETNMWSANPLDFIQNNLVYIIAGIAVIIVIVATSIVFRRRKPPSTQQPSPPSTPPPPPS